MIKVYGIKNCDTVKKAINWLVDHRIEFQFHDYKKDGIDQNQLEEFLKKFGHEKLINRKGTTWRQLEKAEKNSVIDDKSALKLMLTKPSVIKRPILDSEDQLLLGFDAREYEATFRTK